MYSIHVKDLPTCHVAEGIPSWRLPLTLSIHLGVPLTTDCAQSSLTPCSVCTREKQPWYQACAVCLTMERTHEDGFCDSDNLEKGPYDQFLLFGDSITQFSCSQERGFAFTPALQDGETFTISAITGPQ